MHDHTAQQRLQCCLAIPYYLAFQLSTKKISKLFMCTQTSDLPSTSLAMDSTPIQKKKKNFVTSTDGSYLTFPPQSMLTFIHLHPIFLLPTCIKSRQDFLLIQGQFFSCALDSISIRLWFLFI